MAVASSTQRHDSFWSDTFEERGAVVPFTTPVLAYSRVRRQEDQRLELLVPGLAGGRDTYVIPWRSLPTVFAMTVHDRALREEIEVLPESRPEEIREATLRVEGTGLAGAANARAARQAVNNDESERLLTNFFLVSESVRQLSGGKLQLGPAELANDAGRARTKLILSRIAAVFQLTADEFYARLENWAAVASPIGAPGLNYTCRLRQLIADLHDFAGDVEAWSERDFSEAAESARICSQIAEETAGAARTIATGVDRYAADMRGTLNEWTASFARIESLMEKLNWMLDGWRPVITM